jgi:hypothetical protein
MSVSVTGIKNNVLLTGYWKNGTPGAGSARKSSCKYSLKSEVISPANPYGLCGRSLLLRSTLDSAILLGWEAEERRFVILYGNCIHKKNKSA